MRKNAYIIGIDGGDWKILKPLAHKNYLPNLKSILNDNNHQKLISTMPPLTAPAWCSFLTGANPGQHSIFFWQSYWQTNKNRKFLTNRDIKVPQLPEILNKKQVSVGLLNFPFTYPVRKIDGYLISGMLSPKIDERSIYPKKLIPKLIEDKYVINTSINTNTRNEEEINKIINNLNKQTKKRTETFIKLNQQYQPNLRGIVFVSIDRIQHMVYNLIEKKIYNKKLSSKENRIATKALKIYKEVDKSIGKIISRAKKEDLILIISDHGFQKAGKQVNINRILIENNLLKPKFKTNVIFNLIGSLRKFRSFRKYHRFVKKIFSTSRRQIKTKSLADESGKLEAIDLKHSYAFSGLASEQGIFLTKKGEENYQEVTSMIIKALRQAKDPQTNSLIFNQVKKREEAYRGKYVNQAPPVVFSLKPGYKITNPILLNNPIVEKDPNLWRGDHRKEGIILTRSIDEKFFLRKEDTIENVLPIILKFFSV